MRKGNSPVFEGLRPTVGIFSNLLVSVLSDFASRAEHRTVYGIRPYAYGANTVTGTPLTVTVQRPGNL